MSFATSLAAWMLALAALCAGCRGDGAAPGRPSGHDGGALAADGGFPIVVRDDLGRAVELPAEPRRIVALSPPLTETLFALGVGDHVVGVDDSSDFPPEAARLPRLGGLYDAHLEQIVALAPDLVLVHPSDPATERLAAFGIHVWAGAANKMDDVFRVIGAVGHLTGRDGAAAALVTRIHAEMDAIETPLRDKPRVRVYYELDATPYTVGPGSFVGVMLSKAGGENIIPAALGEFPRISPELVIAGDPQVILGVSREEAAHRPGWSAITAVRTGRVDTLTPLEQSLVTRAGPRLAEGLRVLAHRLHPEVAP
jgi:iron complex transport system substrate-binding protein